MYVEIFNKKILIDKFLAIVTLKSDLIDLGNLLITGSDLKVLYLENKRIIISGLFFKIEFKE